MPKDSGWDTHLPVLSDLTKARDALVGRGKDGPEGTGGR